MMGLSTPYLWAGGLVVVLGLVGTAAVTGYNKGYAARHQKAVAELADHLQRAVEQADRLAAADREVMEASAKREVRIQATFQKLETEVDRYDETHRDDRDCLDDSGLLIWSAANAGASDPDAAATPGTGLPEIGDADVGEAGGLAIQPRSNGEGLPPDL